MHSPLQDLPLDPFLPRTSRPAPNPIFFGGNALKRAASPCHSIPSTKRRLLSPGIEETAPLFKASRTTRKSRYAPSVDYAAVLSGPDSPVKALDFSSISLNKTQPEDPQTTPRPRTRSVARSEQAASNDHNPCLDGPSGSSKHAAASRSRRHPLVFELVPRPPPPPPDVTSAHYPGFHVYPDPYTVEARIDESRSLDEPMSLDYEEPDKENTQPPRPIHALRSHLHPPTKSGLFSCPTKGKSLEYNSSSYLSLARRKIYSTTVMEDTFDITETFSYSRQAALASNLPNDDLGHMSSYNHG